MKKFELCFGINNNSVLVPDLLQVSEPKFKFDYDKSLSFFIEYDFLPKTVMPRFIVKMHNDIVGDLLWRTGVVLKDRHFDSTAVVKADKDAKKIYVYVNGLQRLEYFAVIIFSLREINSSFEKMDAVEKVPMPDNPKIIANYEDLINCKADGDKTIKPPGSRKKYDIDELLGRVYVGSKSEDEVLEILRELKKQIPDEDLFIEKANKLLSFNPSFFGLELNVNELISMVLRKRKKNKKK